MNTNTETRIDVLLNRGGAIGLWLRKNTANRLHEPRRAALDYHEAGWIPDDRNPGIICQPRTDSSRLVDVTIWAFMLSIEDGTLAESFRKTSESVIKDKDISAFCNCGHTFVVLRSMMKPNEKVDCPQCGHELTSMPAVQSH